MNQQSKLINEYLFGYLVSLTEHSLGGSQLLGCDWLKSGGHQKPPEIMSCWWHESPAVGNNDRPKLDSQNLPSDSSAFSVDPSGRYLRHRTQRFLSWMFPLRIRAGNLLCISWRSVHWPLSAASSSGTERDCVFTPYEWKSNYWRSITSVRDDGQRSSVSDGPAVLSYSWAEELRRTIQFDVFVSLIVKRISDYPCNINKTIVDLV